MSAKVDVIKLDIGMSKFKMVPKMAMLHNIISNKLLIFYPSHQIQQEKPNFANITEGSASWSKITKLLCMENGI